MPQNTPSLNHLEAALGKKLVRESVASMWYAGAVYTWSDVFDAWIDTNERVTIRPGDSIPQRGETLIAITDA